MLFQGKYRCISCFTELDYENSICDCGFAESKYHCSSYCLIPGTVLNNKYVIGKVIGEGGFGITYVGLDLDLSRRVAVKEFFINGFNTRNSKLDTELGTSTENNKDIFQRYSEKFIEEAKILARFSGEEGVVNVHNYFRENNTAYIVMEYLDGQNLKEYLETRGILTVDELMDIFLPIMNTLHKVHQKKLIHRDISPDNIIVTQSGKTKLLDFGAAREKTDIDKSFSVVLKHGYAPLEQYQTHGEQGSWTDVYALCATMYKCLTGVQPISATDRALEETLQPVYYYNNQCNIEISNVIMRGMSLYSEDRFQTMDELARALEYAYKVSKKSVAVERNVYQAKGEYESHQKVVGTEAVRPEVRAEEVQPGVRSEVVQSSVENEIHHLNDKQRLYNDTQQYKNQEIYVSKAYKREKQSVAKYMYIAALLSILLLGVTFFGLWVYINKNISNTNEIKVDTVDIEEKKNNSKEIDNNNDEDESLIVESSGEDDIETEEIVAAEEADDELDTEPGESILDSNEIISEETDNNSEIKKETKLVIGVEEDQVVGGTCKVTESGVKIRASASVSSEVIGSTTKGVVLEIISQTTDYSGNIWYEVIVTNNTTGYIRSDLVSEVKWNIPQKKEQDKQADNTTIMYIQGSVVANTHIRKSASASASIVASVKPGDIFSILGQKEDSAGKIWHQVEYKGKTGYIRYDLVEMLE